MFNNLFKWSTADEDDFIRKRKILKDGEVAVPFDINREEVILFYTADGFPVYKDHYTKVWVKDPLNGIVYPSYIELDFIAEINVSTDYIYMFKKNISE